jgi:hypothetical protein
MQPPAIDADASGVGAHPGTADGARCLGLYQGGRCGTREPSGLGSGRLCADHSDIVDTPLNRDAAASSTSLVGF